jgi:glutamate/tyrosine decarboxylase-like PLP-dependent enzyme
MTPTGTTSGRDSGDAVLGGCLPASDPHLDRVGAEDRLVGFALDLVHAPEGAAGLQSASSAASALQALLAARDARPDVPRPTVVLTDTADPAYLRAAALLGVEPVVVATDPTARAAIGPMAHEMDERTVLAVVSAPSPALGVLDPVAWIGTAAAAKRVPLHVDARAGGWLLAYGERLGRVVPPWTFAAPGVTSVALDLPTGATPASLLLFRDPSARRVLTASHASGPGVPWVTDGCASTEVPSAVAWRAVERTGHDGYLRLAGGTLRAVEEVVAGVVAVPGLHLAHVPDAAVVVLRADAGCDVATVAEELAVLGCPVPAVAQPSWRQLPPTLRLEVGPRTDVDAVLVALETAALAARGRGPAVLPTRLLDHLARLDPAHLSLADVRVLLDALELDPATVGHHGRFALLLDACPTRLRAAVAARVHELRHSPVRA